MKKLKVFGVPWHVGHQYELAKLPFFEKYDLLINPYRTWGTSHRPFPEKCNWVTEYKKGEYDLAILHVDQQSIYNPEQGDRIHKGKMYLELREVIGNDVPIVTINHMTPFHDKYEPDYVVEFLKKMVEGTYMIVNSHEAATQWGFGHPVIHGMEIDQWENKPKEPRCVIVLSPEGMDKAYRRIFIRTVKRMLEEMGVPCIWVGVDIKFKSFEEYQDYLSRSLVFFMGTWQSPMPRARTEAMLSGCCVVTTPYHDAHTFIEHGVNGFLTSPHPIVDPRVMDNPEVTAKLIKRLVMDDPDEAIRVGNAGRETAQQKFCSKAFEDQWLKVLKEVLNYEI